MSTAFHPTINARAKDYEAPPDEVKKQILTFLEDLRINGMPSSKERPYFHLGLPSVLNQWMATAGIHGAKGALADPEGAARVPLLRSWLPWRTATPRENIKSHIFP